MHKANGGLCGCSVNCQTRKPHCHVAALCSLTACGFVAVYNLGHGVGVTVGELVGCKRIFPSCSLFEAGGVGRAAPQGQTDPRGVV